MNIGKGTAEMIELYESGWTLDEIGAKFGISGAAVRQRFNRLGVNCSPSLKYETLDKERLENLYHAGKLFREIAAEFSVCQKTIKNALIHFRIPERPPLYKIDTPAHRTAALEMIEDYKNGMTCKEIAAKNNICDNTLKKRIAVFNFPFPNRTTDRLLTDEAKKNLEDLYLTRRLRTTDIAKHFKTSWNKILKALKFHNIQTRQPIGGSHINKFKKLKIGETVIVNTTAKYPITNLHSISKRIPIKISIRRLGEGNFQITRVK